jgi:hypothetical protein
MRLKIIVLRILKKLWVEVWSRVEENNINSNFIRKSFLSGKFNTNYKTKILNQTKSNTVPGKKETIKKGLGFLHINQTKIRM